MSKRRQDSRGFTLIAALLLTLLMSALAVGLLYLVNNEQRMGGNDLEGNEAYYGAESGIENLTAQLSILYQTSQTPTAASINALTNPANFPNLVAGSNITNTNYVESITWPANQTNGQPCVNAPNPCGSWDIVGSGSDQGMVASLIPFTLQVTATRASTAQEATTNAAISPTGASVNLARTVEVALLPAFEFGVFCDGDCDYFAGPNFNFGGRVHTNGSLFLASGSSLTFTDKIAAVNQVVMDQLENGWPTNNGYPGAIYVPSAAGACPPAPGSGPAANCSALPAGSWTGGFPPPPSPGICTAGCGGAANPNWRGISTDAPTGIPAGFNSFIINGLTGATKLQLPFVGTSPVGAIDIIRRPQASDTPLLSASRLYGKAEIRVLIADTIGDLHPERGAGVLDADDVQIGISAVNGGTATSSQLSYTGLATTDYMYFGIATAGNNGWVNPTNPATGTAYNWGTWPLMSQITSSPTNVNPAPAIAHVWVRVEYLNNAGTWVGVTRQWLGYGFGRPYNTPPTAPWGSAAGACPSYPAFPAAQCYNPVSPAILILQQLNQGVAVASAYETDTTDSSGTANNWIPINFYDSREGEPRDTTTRPTNTTSVVGQTVYTPCSSSGVMNAVELDVGNLWLWLQKTGPYTGGSGALVNSTNQGGYILYFSDRRGMLADPNATGTSVYNRITGTSGLEDTVNATSATGVPDGVLEPATYYSYSPEDVSGDNFLDNYGEKNLAAGFGLVPPYTSQPYYPIPANGITLSANQVNCSSYKYLAGGTVETYPPANGTAGATVIPGNPQTNVVYGARHVLRLVDSGMDNAANSYLPHPPAGQYGDGFTVASEEPVYVWGDYNSGTSDPFWPSGGNPTGANHSAASIIADSVTLLSNPPSGVTAPVTFTGWTDVESFLQPGVVTNRPGNTSYYRMAIAAGKSIPFPEPGWATAAALKDFGTDGGMHNFLRYLEDRGASGAVVNYTGSLISMYYSQYDTGVFKCCNRVYGAPTRNYFFDTQFLNPNNLPPGTPMFQDVVSLSYHQNFTPQ
jgi:Tfp pilus assembly protein PilX